MNEDTYKKLSLLNINNGALVDQFEEALRQVLINISNPNIPSDGIRKINIEIAFIPKKDKSFADIQTKVSVKLPALKPCEGYAILGGNDDNKLDAYISDIKQPDLPCMEDNTINFTKEVK